MSDSRSGGPFNRSPRHTGASSVILEAIRRAGEPLSVYKLFLATGIRVETIRSMLGQMVGRTGGVVSVRGAKGVFYYSPYVPTPRRAAPVADGEFATAARITIPSYRWGSSRLG